MGTLAEGGSPTQLTCTKAPRWTRLPRRLSAEELACNAGGLQDTQFSWLDREDPREEEMASHINILAWEVPRTEEPGGLQSIVSQKSQT